MIKEPAVGAAVGLRHPGLSANEQVLGRVARPAVLPSKSSGLASRSSCSWSSDSYSSPRRCTSSPSSRLRKRDDATRRRRLPTSSRTTAGRSSSPPLALRSPRAVRGSGGRPIPTAATDRSPSPSSLPPIWGRRRGGPHPRTRSSLAEGMSRSWRLLLWTNWGRADLKRERRACLARRSRRCDGGHSCGRLLCSRGSEHDRGAWLRACFSPSLKATDKGESDGFTDSG
jgi:hypothetical protein